MNEFLLLGEYTTKCKPLGQPIYSENAIGSVNKKPCEIGYIQSVDLIASFVMFTLTMPILYVLQSRHNKIVFLFALGFRTVRFFKQISLSVTEIAVSYAKNYLMRTLEALSGFHPKKGSTSGEILTMSDTERIPQKLYSLFSVHASRRVIGYAMQTGGQIC